MVHLYCDNNANEVIVNDNTRDNSNKLMETDNFSKGSISRETSPHLQNSNRSEGGSESSDHSIDNLKTRASSSPSSSNPHSPLSPPTSKLNMQIVYEHLYDFGKPILAKDDMELIKKAYDAKFYLNGSKRNITKRESTTIMERLFGAIMITVEASSRPFPYRDRNVTNILDAFDIIKDKMDNEPSLSNKKRMAKWKKMLSKQIYL